MLHAEKKSLWQFASLLIVFNFIFLLIATLFYYHYQKNSYIDLNKQTILTYANRIVLQTIDAKNLDELKNQIVYDTHFEVFFIAKNKILFTTSKNTTIQFFDGFFEHEHFLQYSEKIKMRYLKEVDYLIIKRNGIHEDLQQTKQLLFIFLALSTFVLSIGIVLLSKLFLKPMREYANALDKFIRDTTHELNTPLSVITMSIERINDDNFGENNQKQLKRIKIAAKTIATLYDDLTFLVQYKNFQDKLENLDVAEIVLERICYFRELAQSKKIVINDNLKSKNLLMDKQKLIRIIDNLISNAIKYNKKNGVVNVYLDDDCLIVTDTGIGIRGDKIDQVFNLFSRFDEANGGFGIGLNLVKMICDEYNFAIRVNSDIAIGTSFKIFFKGQN